MSEGEKRPEHVKDDRRVHDTVHVQLAQELDGSDTPLVELEDIFLFVS